MNQEQVLIAIGRALQDIGTALLAQADDKLTIGGVDIPVTPPPAAQTFQPSPAAPVVQTPPVAAPALQTPPPAAQAVPPQAAQAVPPQAAQAASDLTLTQVQETVGTLVRTMDEGKQARMLELIRGYGVDRVSALDPSRYAEFLTAAKVIAND